MPMRARWTLISGWLWNYSGKNVTGISARVCGKSDLNPPSMNRGIPHGNAGGQHLTGLSRSTSLSLRAKKEEEGGTLFDIEPDLAAVVTPGLHPAFQDRRQVRLSGQTILRENASRDIWVCGPGSLTVLKALAFGDRGANKDAYDLAYVWRALGVDEIAGFLAPLLWDPVVAHALSIIREDFTNHNGIGPRRAAAFQPGVPSDETQADVVGMATRLLGLLGN